MAFLSSEPLTFSGGCFCKANRYTIKIPALEDRGFVPKAIDTPIAAETDRKLTTVPTRFPLVDLDHCDSCRRTSGAIVQCWFICPTSWVTWDILASESHSSRDEPSNLGTPRLNEKAKDGEAGSIAFPSDANSSPTRAGVITQVPAILAIGPPHPRQECEGAKALPVSLKQPELLGKAFLSHYKSSADVNRTFCSRCGTNLTYFMDRPTSAPIPPIVDIAVGSLDRESIDRIRPDRHGWWEEAVGWVKQLLRNGDGGFLIRHPGGNIGLEVTD
ncbi:hypothetical protein V1504DRAFT_462821 [Lipomyces starkeyi]